MQASSKRWREDVGFEMFNRVFSDSWRSKVTLMLTMLCYRLGEPSAVIKKGFYRVGKSVLSQSTALSFYWRCTVQSRLQKSRLISSACVLGMFTLRFTLLLHF